jgi:hypothetical protein
MRRKIVILAVIFASFALRAEERIPELKLENLPFKKNIREKIFEGQIFSESHVRNLNKNDEQSLSFSVAGLHPKSCAYALRTLSLYEDYSRFLSFVKVSKYDEQKKEIDFLISHALMPYDMRLIFTLPRITTTGTYPFSFEIGILKNLQGKIHVINVKNSTGDRCLFYSTADWTGPTTGFNPFVFELFSKTLADLSMEILFRISSSLSH